MSRPQAMKARDRCGGPSYGRATTSRCPHKADRKGGDRYCPACRAACMREYRQRVKDRLEAELPRCEACGGHRSSVASPLCKACCRAAKEAANKAVQRPRGIARSYANVYQRRGLLIPQPCQACGSTERVEKHHPDYRKPLEVEWLCRPCHRAHHQIASRETIPQERA